MSKLVIIVGLLVFFGCNQIKRHDEVNSIMNILDENEYKSINIIFYYNNYFSNLYTGITKETIKSNPAMQGAINEKFCKYRIFEELKKIEYIGHNDNHMNDIRLLLILQKEKKSILEIEFLKNMDYLLINNKKYKFSSKLLSLVLVGMLAV